jgi:DNA-binding beta-propeller fold protein YncE
VVAGAAAAVLVAGTFAFALVRLIGSDGLAGIDENFVGLIDAQDQRIVHQYPVGHSPGAVVTGSGSVWVANTLDDTVSRIDRERGEVVTIPRVSTVSSTGSSWPGRA